MNAAIIYLASTAMGSLQTPAVCVQEIVDAAAPRNAASISVGLVKKGRAAIKYSVGYADIEASERARPDTRYEVASLTKQFTAVAVLQLVEKGKLSFDSTLGSLLEGFPAAWQDITVYQLLNHTAGLKDFTAVPDIMAMPTEDLNPRAILEALAPYALEFEPGSSWSYSNSGYFVLGLIVEAVSGLTYSEYLTSYIFKPAGMFASAGDIRSASGNRTAKGYIYTDGVPAPGTTLDPNFTYAAGAVVSSVNDLVTWNLKLHEGALVSQRYLDMAWSNGALSDGTAIKDPWFGGGYGLGWFVGDSPDKNVNHMGLMPTGFTNYVYRSRQTGWSIIVLSNGFTASPFADAAMRPWDLAADIVKNCKLD